MRERVNILHLEDSELDFQLIQILLSDSGLDCSLTRIERESELITALESDRYDLVLADYNLPGFYGLQALEVVRKTRPELPFLFLSGTIGEDIAIESLQKGASDYIIKDRLARLVPAIRRALTESNERAKLRAMEETLLQSQRLEAIGTLAAGIAHDFNNILNIISGHIALLELESFCTERMRNVVQTTQRAVRRGADLVQQLLTFASERDSVCVVIDVNKCVQRLVEEENFPPAMRVGTQLEADAPTILADPAQFDRILRNLLTNAQEALPEGGDIGIATAVVRASASGQDGETETSRWLRVQITDNGVGMDEITRQRVFQPFFTTKPRGRGTGLGLPVVYGLMRTHHGFVDVESAPGKGTTVSLFFPLHEAASTPALAPEYREQVAASSSETILVVEDEPDIRNFLQALFEMEGYRVLMAHDGYEAQRLFAKHREDIQVVFSDVGLGEFDGFSLCAGFKEQKPDLKAILTSGHSDGRMNGKTRAFVDGFVSKPYQVNELLDRVRAALQHSDGTGAVAEERVGEAELLN